MKNQTFHLIHPTLQFEAKEALRLLDNLLKTRTTAVSGGGDLFGAVGVFASGRDLKVDFASLKGEIGPFAFKWDGDTLDCSSPSDAGFIRRGTFEVHFGDEPCDFLDEIWNCPSPEARACVRSAVARLAKAVSDVEPAADGGVGARFAALARRHRLSARERDLLLAALCDAHCLLEYELDIVRRGGRFLPRLEEAAAYLGCGVDDLLPLVRNDAKLVACGLLDGDLDLTGDALEFLEGHVAVPALQAKAVAITEEDYADIVDDFREISDDDWN